MRVDASVTQCIGDPSGSVLLHAPNLPGRYAVVGLADPRSPPSRLGHNDGVVDRLPTGVFIVVSGPPASGKTTLAQALAPAAGLPLIAKDTIKQALMGVLPVPDVAASRVVGRASVAALLAVAAESGGAVLESV
jgi:hypothetical protein